MRAVGEHVLRQEMPVEDGQLLEVVMQHDRLQTSLAAMLDRLGFRRRTRDVDVASVLAGYHHSDARPPQPAPAPEPEPASTATPGDGDGGEPAEARGR